MNIKPFRSYIEEMTARQGYGSDKPLEDAIARLKARLEKSSSNKPTKESPRVMRAGSPVPPPEKPKGKRPGRNS